MFATKKQIDYSSKLLEIKAQPDKVPLLDPEQLSQELDSNLKASIISQLNRGKAKLTALVEDLNSVENILDFEVLLFDELGGILKPISRALEIFHPQKFVSNLYRVVPVSWVTILSKFHEQNLTS